MSFLLRIHWRRVTWRTAGLQLTTLATSLCESTARRWCWAISLFWRAAYFVSFVSLRRYNASCAVYLFMMLSFNQVHCAVLRSAFNVQRSASLHVRHLRVSSSVLTASNVLINPSSSLLHPLSYDWIGLCVSFGFTVDWCNLWSGLTDSGTDRLIHQFRERPTETIVDCWCDVHNEAANFMVHGKFMAGEASVWCIWTNLLNVWWDQIDLIRWIGPMFNKVRGRTRYPLDCKETTWGILSGHRTWSSSLTTRGILTNPDKSCGFADGNKSTATT